MKKKDETALRKACINLIIQDALEVTDKERFIADIMIHGYGGPLREAPTEDLVEETFNRLCHCMTGEELDKCEQSDDELHSWIMSQKIHYEWYY